MRARRRTRGVSSPDEQAQLLTALPGASTVPCDTVHSPMASNRTSRALLADGVPVRLRRPCVVAALCTLTLGITGAVHHHRINVELGRFGRARGAMPFPFITVNAGAATLTWIGGLLLWLVVVASVATWGVALAMGDATLAADDVSSLAGLALLLAPLWLTGLHTMRRIRRAQFLVGVEQPTANPWRGAAFTALVPPLGSWNAQRELSRAWSVWRT